MLPKKNILFMVGGSYVSGAEITTLNLIRDLHIQGYQILVIVSGWNDGDFIQRLNQYKIPYKSIKLGFIFLTKPFWTLDSLIHYPKAFLQLRSITKHFNPDCIIHCSYRTFLMGYPVFMQRNNIYLEHNNPIINRSNSTLYHFLAKKINHFVCPSKTVKNTLLRLAIPSSKIRIIPSPVDPEFVKFNAKHKAINEIAHVGIIGQIHQEKGFDFVFEELAKIKHDYSLYIYGDDKGEYAKQLKINIPNTLKNKINWMGYVKNRLDIYSNLDIVIFPSLSESFGRIIIEAGSLGIPVIASDIECFKEIIAHGETGYLFKLSNTAELPHILEKLMTNISLRKTIGKNAQSYVLNNFTSEQCTEKYKNIIEY